MVFSNLKNSVLGKLMTVVLVSAFSFYNCDLSSAMTSPEVKPPEVASESEMLSVEDIGIAIDAGTIRSKFSGGTGRTIVHIQDAHCNFEAQSNISRILEQLSRDAGIDMISVEGAEGTVDTAWFRAFPDAEIRREVATYFMKKGEITGAEFFSINSDYDGTIFGAETRDYYVQNLRAFLDMYPYKDSVLAYLNDLKSVGDRLKAIVYPPKLRELDRNAAAFEKKEMDLSEYSEYLQKTSLDVKIEIKEHVNFGKLISTLEYEKKIDFDIVDEERTRYIDGLSKVLSKEKMAELVAQSIRFKKGYIKAVDFYSHLRDLAKAHDIPMLQEYPNLFYYYIYSKIYDGIEIEGLFKEIDLIERALKEKLITDETQYKLDKLSEKVSKLIGLVNIELTNDDYDRFRMIAGAFSIEDVVSFFGSLSSRYNLNYSIGDVPSVVKENLPKMVEFYEIAIKRDMALVENTLAQMEKQGKDRSVLIAGGFHTRGMVDLLEKRGVSYVVVTPKITKDVESPYIQVLTNQRTSIEDIITESALPGTRGEISPDGGELLSPLLRFGWGITMILNPEERAALKAVSDAIGSVQGAPTFEASVEESFRTAVAMVAERWIVSVKNEMVTQLGMEVQDAEEEFLRFVNDDSLWSMLQSVYLKKYDDYFRSIGEVSPAAVRSQIQAGFTEYRDKVRGTAASATQPVADVSADPVITPPSAEARKVIDLLSQGSTASIKPHTEAKVWGVNGIGEYWYGAEAGDKSSIVVVRDESGTEYEASLNEVIRHAPEILGLTAADNFGQMLPLVKILTPASRLSMQFHDTKNELWIVTGIDPNVPEPSIILGFSRQSVDRYGKDVTAEYAKALESYGIALNTLIGVASDLGLTEGFRGDILEKAKQSRENYPVLSGYIDDCETARQEVEFFYNYRPVKVGDVIPVPAGTLHALGAGIEVVEPQIAGATQSLEDGATFPVRYYFPGFETPGAQKKLDIDRTGEMSPTVAVETKPDVVFESSDGKTRIERLPGNFESKGLEVNRIILAKGQSIEMPAVNSIHSLVVVNENGKASITIGDRETEIPSAKAVNPMLMVPATVDRYTITASEDTEIILTFTPSPEPWYLPLPVENGDVVDIKGQQEFTHSLTPKFLEYGNMVDVRDELVIHAGQEALSSPIVSGRPHRLVIKEGAVAVATPEGPVTLAKGDEFPVEKDLANVTKDPGLEGYKMRNSGAEAAVVEVVYELSQEEKVAYETIAAVKKHIPVIMGKKIRVHVPNEIFPRGGKTVVGSLAWTQEIIKNLVGAEVTLSGYDSSLGFGRLKTSKESDVEILVADDEKLQAAKEVEGAQDFIKDVRVLPIPKTALAQKNGWDFCMESVGWSLVLGAVDPMQIRDRGDVTSPASDMHRFLTKVLKQQVDREHLFLMLSFNEVNAYMAGVTDENEREEIVERIGEVNDVVNWMKNLVKNILFQMPIRPFDPADTLRQRLKVMWSA